MVLAWGVWLLVFWVLVFWFLIIDSGARISGFWFLVVGAFCLWCMVICVLVFLV